MNNKEKNIEEMLDATLAEYSNVEPRAGLEDRILARLSGAKTSPERYAWLSFWPQWAVACAIVFGFLALTVWRTKPAQQVVDTPEIAVPLPAETIPTLHALVKTPSPRPHFHAPQTSAPEPRQVAVVRQEIFPAPSPLSDQERLLFSYMRRTNRSEIAANAKPDALPAIEQKINEQQINQVLPGQRNSDSNTNTR